MPEFKHFDVRPHGPYFSAIVQRESDRFKDTDNPFRVCITPAGLCINGDYGVSPSKEEMREALELMREAVKAWDKHYGTA